MGSLAIDSYDVIANEKLIAQMVYKMPFALMLDEDDRMQEARIAFVNAKRTYNPDKGASFKTYFATVLRRHLSDAVCREIGRPKNKDSGELQFTSMDREFKHYTDPLTLHDVIGHEPEEPSDTLDVLSKAVGKLSPIYRDIIKMRFVDDMTLREIGARLGYSHERVRQLQENALDRLRRTVAL